jgi:hypothetical protein
MSASSSSSPPLSGFSLASDRRGSKHGRPPALGTDSGALGSSPGHMHRARCVGSSSVVMCGLMSSGLALPMRVNEVHSGPPVWLCTMSSQQSLATKVEATTGNDDHNDVEPSGDMYREEWVRSRPRTLHGQRRRGHGLCNACVFSSK